jgi:sugar O-acyltransferase (sialic acid O-acetyltransferase NeuD family)
MSGTLVVVGASGFGRETLDVVTAINRAGTGEWDLRGVVDDGPSPANLARLAARGIRYLASLEEFLVRPVADWFVVGIGAPAVREGIAARLSAAGLHAATLVHPSATVGECTTLGAGTVVCAGVAVSTNVETGEHVHLNPNSTIGHDTRLDDFVSVNPGAIVSGECHIGTRCLIGAGAVVLQGLSVGPDTVVGAAACLTKDPPAGVVAKGIPARW